MTPFLLSGTIFFLDEILGKSFKRKISTAFNFECIEKVEKKLSLTLYYYRIILTLNYRHYKIKFKGVQSAKSVLYFKRLLLLIGQRYKEYQKT